MDLAPAIRRCPRCGYRGEGIPYFGRGTHLGLLIILVVMTAWAFGAGGIVYYLARRKHRVCPRCGLNWGVDAEGAPVAGLGRGESAPPSIPSPRRETTRSGWGIVLLVTAVLFGVIAVATGDLTAIVFAVAAAIGAVLTFQGARRERDLRRAALLSDAQARVLRLAGEREGTITVSEVALHFGWPIARAERVLESLEDGFRVRSDVTDDGRIVYAFRELLGPEEERPGLRAPEEHA